MEMLLGFEGNQQYKRSLGDNITHEDLCRAVGRLADLLQCPEIRPKK